MGTSLEETVTHAALATGSTFVGLSHMWVSQRIEHTQGTQHQNVSRLEAALHSRSYHIASTVMLTSLSMYDQVTDVLLAIEMSDRYLWFTAISLCSILFQHGAQVLVLIWGSAVPLFTWDCCMAAVGLGPVQQAYHSLQSRKSLRTQQSLASKSKVPPDVMMTIQMAMEAGCEAIPQIFLQLILLSKTPKSAMTTLQLVSLTSSVTCTSVSMVQLEQSLTDFIVKVIGHPCEQYALLPISRGLRRRLMLICMVAAIGSHLIFVLVSATIASPAVTVGVCVASSVLYRASFARSGDYRYVWMLAKAGSSNPAILVDFLFRMLLWLWIFFEPATLVSRLPVFGGGPRRHTLTALTSFAGAAVLTALALREYLLAVQNNTSTWPAEMVWLGAPAGVTSLLCISIMLRLAGPISTQTLCEHVGAEAFIQRWITAASDLSIKRDRDRIFAAGLLMVPFGVQAFGGEEVTRWLHKDAPSWEVERPAWYSSFWVERLPPEYRIVLADSISAGGETPRVFVSGVASASPASVPSTCVASQARSAGGTCRTATRLGLGLRGGELAHACPATAPIDLWPADPTDELLSCSTIHAPHRV